jgi:hypothetical protein
MENFTAPHEEMGDSDGLGGEEIGVLDQGQH